ncbi:MAG: hypothetical protein U1E35_07940 [Rhodospirillales bacterium]
MDVSVPPGGPPGSPAAASAGKDGGHSRRRRWPFILLAAVVLLGAAGYGILRFAPGYIAGSLARTYFEGLNIDTGGVRTMDINLLRGEVSFGPVKFGGGKGEAAQVGRIRVKMDLRRLLHRQAVIEDAEISGIRIDIRQAADGALSINDIPLSHILAERAATHQRKTGSTPAAPPPDAETSRSWGMGFDHLRLHDSSIVFTSKHGGTATIAVNDLDLAGFATWAPDEPGRVALDGDLNGIHIVLNGTATPLADTIGIDAELEVTGIEIGKIEAYTGRLGFDRGDGRIDMAVTTSGSKIMSDGHVDAHLTGKAAFNSFDLVHQNAGSLKLGTAAVNLDDVQLLYDPDGTIDVAGSATLSADGMDLRLHDGTEVGLDGAKIGLPGLRARLPAAGKPSAAAAPRIDVRALRLGGRHVEGTANDIAVHLEDLAFDGNEAPAPLAARGTVAVGRLALLLPLKKPIRIGGEAIGLELPGMRFGFGPRTVIDGPFGIDLSALPSPSSNARHRRHRNIRSSISAPPGFWAGSRPSASTMRRG